MSEKKGDLTAFLRIFKYVRPQWPRLVAVVAVVILIAILYSLSFMTIGPLLKVMMGEEGLHGWVDRKLCNRRYGLDFYVPELVDFTEITDNQLSSYLQITLLDEAKSAFRAGLRVGDKVIGIGAEMPKTVRQGVPAARLLENLANAEQDLETSVLVRRESALGISEEHLLKLVPPAMEGLEAWVTSRVRSIMRFVPRGQTRATKRRAIILIIIVMAVVTVIRCLARFVQNYLVEAIVLTSMTQLREDCFAKVMHMPIRYFSVGGVSDTISRINGDTSATGAGVKIVLGKALREPMKAVGLLAAAMYISVKLCLIFLTIAPVTLVMFGVLGRKIRKATRASLRGTAALLGRVTAVVNALSVVKVYNNQDRESERYRVINRRLLRQTLRIAKVQAMTGPLMEVLGMLAGSAALIVGAFWVTSVDAAVHIKPSDFLVLLVLLGSAAESIRKVSDVWNKIQGANAASDRVFEIIDLPSEDEKPHSKSLATLQDSLEFRNVKFSYPGSRKLALNGVTLKVEKGETVAVVGPNGSGKTTLINLIPRFFDPDSGTILIDGCDTRDVTLSSLREKISMVTQNVVTFNESIAENIGYGKPDATREEVVEAAKRAFVHEFVAPLPEGYETLIGENNAGFSGGQLQRIVIARALLNNPEILIFDEAMSQVDADSEAKINSALESVMENRTCFVIAHRFSTVVSADRIIVMQEGRVVAQGSHSELLEQSPLYRSLYETQLLTPQ